MQTHCPLGPASYGKGRAEEEIKKESKKSQSGPSGLETMIATESKLQKQRILFQLLKIVNYNMPLTFDTMYFCLLLFFCQSVDGHVVLAGWHQV